ncbi:NUDIX hydrolase [Lysobacter sp. CA199]|uniref:NUDIX hydrolase n=1 Tax=Lysobacter sp. CA199 TaxID=3455608 RepID=UPI003F8D195D
MPAKHSDAIGALRSNLIEYARRWPEEAEHTQPFLDLLDEALQADRRGGPASAASDDASQHDASGAFDPFVRGRLAGHFTGGVWLVDRAGRRVLLTHHRKLGRWLQLGGHADGDRDLAQVALKEAEEESGLTGLSVEPELFDLDRHWIPERREVPGHWHYDLRYVVHVGDSEDYVVSEESLDLAWREIAELLDDPGSDDSMRRMARKWLARAGAGSAVADLRQ